jgi:hypothetical protein
VHEVDVVVVKCRAGEEGAVWVEGGAGDRGGAVVVEEAGVGLKGREIAAVDIVCLDFVAVGAPIRD